MINEAQTYELVTSINGKEFKVAFERITEKIRYKSNGSRPVRIAVAIVQRMINHWIKAYNKTQRNLAVAKAVAESLKEPKEVSLPNKIDPNEYLKNVSGKDAKNIARGIEMANKGLDTAEKKSSPLLSDVNKDIKKYEKRAKKALLRINLYQGYMSNNFKKLRDIFKLPIRMFAADRLNKLPTYENKNVFGPIDTPNPNLEVSTKPLHYFDKNENKDIEVSNFVKKVEDYYKMSDKDNQKSSDEGLKNMVKESGKEAVKQVNSQSAPQDDKQVTSPIIEIKSVNPVNITRDIVLPQVSTSTLENDDEKSKTPADKTNDQEPAHKPSVLEKLQELKDSAEKSKEKDQTIANLEKGHKDDQETIKSLTEKNNEQNKEIQRIKEQLAAKNVEDQSKLQEAQSLMDQAKAQAQKNVADAQANENKANDLTAFANKLAALQKAVDDKEKALNAKIKALSGILAGVVDTPVADINAELEDASKTVGTGTQR